MTMKQLLVRLNQVCRKNIGKAIYALFAIMVLEIIFSFVFMVPSATLIAKTGSGPQTMALSTLLFFVGAIVWLTFQFGLSIMLLRLSRNQNASPGFIFLGFRKFNPAGKIIFAFGGIFAATAFIAGFLARSAGKAIFSALSASEKEALSEIAAVTPQIDAAASIQLGFFLIFFFVLSFIAVIHFAFVFQLHFDEPRLSVPALFKKSASMMHGNVFRLIVFALRAGGKNLLIAIVFAVIATLFPSEKGGLSVLNFLFDLVYFINLFSALVKFYFTVPILYDSILNPQPQFEIVISASDAVDVQINSETAPAASETKTSEDNGRENCTAENDSESGDGKTTASSTTGNENADSN